MLKENSYYLDVIDYFDSKADVYDDVDHQLYWVLSDMFFKEVLKKELSTFLDGREELKLLDAGAGTGRWALFFHELFHKEINISGNLVDINAKMLEQAEMKIRQLALEENFLCQVGNIEEMPEVGSQSYDIALSFYNVLSFVQEPHKALLEIADKLKAKGLHISIVANKYHAYYFSLLTNQTKELSMIRNHSKVRFNELMPYIHCFSPDELRKLYLASGFSDVKIIGGPNFFYPGMDETLTSGSTESIDNLLGDKGVFQEILDIELECYAQQDLTGRGNVLMAIAEK